VHGSFDAIVCANMLHIAPWACCAALMQGAARHLASAGLLLTYGPYSSRASRRRPSNLAFDADLRARDAAWGVRRCRVERRGGARGPAAARARRDACEQSDAGLRSAGSGVTQENHT
jgi:hypothetical protein